MPTMANMTVKKSDGTTDIVYTAIQASGGDKSPAIWRSNTVSTAAGFRPELRVSSRPNGDGTARRVEGSYTYPSIVTGTDGITRVASRMNLNFTAVVPLSTLDVDANEAGAQVANLIANALMKAVLQTGFAPA